MSHHPGVPCRGTSHLAAGGDVLGPATFLQYGLRRREPRERDAVRRAAHVVEPEPVAELDRARLSSVLAADAELDVRLGAAAALGRVLPPARARLRELLAV